MTQTANYFKLGLFVILSLCLCTAFLVVFGAGQFLKKEMLAETCFNESVQGLDVGSDVKYKGVKIGTVKAITTPTKVYGVPSSLVLVVFALDDNAFATPGELSPEQQVRDAVEKGLQVYLSFKGLTGSAYLETDYLPGQRLLDISWEPENIYIPSRRSHIKQLGDALNQVLENLSRMNIAGITTNLERLLVTLNRKTDDIDLAAISTQSVSMLTEIRETNRQMAETLGSPGLLEMIRDAQSSFQEVKTIVADARAPVAQTLRNLAHTTEVAKNLTDGADERITTRAREISDQVGQLLESLNKTVTMMETLVWLNTDTLNKTLDNFEHTSENLKQLSIELRHYPGRLLFESPPRKITRETQGVETHE